MTELAVRNVNVAKWLDELRSGKHAQVRAKLKDTLPEGGFGYCCLGVVAEHVLGHDFQNCKTFEGDFDAYGYSVDHYGYGNTTELGADDTQLLGLHHQLTEGEVERINEYISEVTDRNGEILTHTTRETTLMYLNDEYELTFPQIAEVIEMLGWDLVKEEA